MSEYSEMTPEAKKKFHEKNTKRIEDIVSKSEGDKAEMAKLAQTQADRIDDPVKAYTRGKEAEKQGQSEVAKIFLDRASALGYEDNNCRLMQRWLDADAAGRASRAGASDPGRRQTD